MKADHRGKHVQDDIRQMYGTLKCRLFCHNVMNVLQKMLFLKNEGIILSLISKTH